jgi:hypothetical protein
MELIAQRVARGQEVKPLNRKRKNPKVEANGSPDTLSLDPEEDSKPKGFLKQGVSVLKTGYQAIGGQQVSVLSWRNLTGGPDERLSVHPSDLCANCCAGCWAARS